MSSHADPSLSISLHTVRLATQLVAERDAMILRSKEAVPAK